MPASPSLASSPPTLLQQQQRQRQMPQRGSSSSSSEKAADRSTGACGRCCLRREAEAEEAAAHDSTSISSVYDKHSSNSIEKHYIVKNREKSVRWCISLHRCSFSCCSRFNISPTASSDGTAAASVTFFYSAPARSHLARRWRSSCRARRRTAPGSFASLTTCGAKRCLRFLTRPRCAGSSSSRETGSSS